MKFTKILCQQNKKNIFENLNSTTLKTFSTINNNNLLNSNSKNSNIINKINFLTSKTTNSNLFNFNKFNFSKRIHEQSTFKDLTSKHKNEVKINKTDNSNQAAGIDTQNPQSTKVTSKLLCELIGCKHYLSNEEINIEEDELVNVYDESDKFLGKQTFGEALKQAKDIGKDIILRNDKVSPQVVKIMKYKVELVKRLMKKLGKTVESEKKENVKYMTLSNNISENDFHSKENKIKELLAHFSYIRIVIPCDITNTEQTIKSTSLLNTLSNDLSDFCKIKAGPIRQKQKKQKIESVDSKLTDSIQKINKQEKEIKEAFELSQITEVNSDKDLDYISCVYIDYESLLLDSTGINYEKLLENVNLENLVKGIAKTNIVNRVKIFYL